MKNILKKIFCVVLGGLTAFGGLISFRTTENVIANAADEIYRTVLDGFQFYSIKNDINTVGSKGYDTQGNSSYSYNKTWTFIREGQYHNSWKVEPSNSDYSQAAYGGGSTPENLYFICDEIEGYVTEFHIKCNSIGGHYILSLSVDGEYFTENAQVATVPEGKAIQTEYWIGAPAAVGKPSGRVIIAFTTDEPDVLYLDKMRVYFSTTPTDLSVARKNFSASGTTHSQLGFTYSLNYGKRETTTPRSNAGVYGIDEKYFLGNKLDENEEDPTMKLIGKVAGKVKKLVIYL